MVIGTRGRQARANMRGVSVADFAVNLFWWALYALPVLLVVAVVVFLTRLYRIRAREVRELRQMRSEPFTEPGRSAHGPTDA